MNASLVCRHNILITIRAKLLRSDLSRKFVAVLSYCVRFFGNSRGVVSGYFVNEGEDFEFFFALNDLSQLLMLYNPS